MSSYRRTKTPGVYVRHQVGCPASESDGPRCRCTPSWRGRRRHPLTRAPEWSPVLRGRAEALTWIGAGSVGAEAVHERAHAGHTFQALAESWWEGVQTGAIGKRKGKKGSAYSPTTLADYRRSLRHILLPEFGPRPAREIDEVEWQAWVDMLSREGLSRSRIATHIAVVSAVYGWASRPSRRLVPRNPTRSIELPPNDEQPRMRVATCEEAEALLEALAEGDAVSYALAFFAGLRRAEIHRLDWRDVELDGYRLLVRTAKSEAGTGRRPPIAEPLRAHLLRAHLRAGRPDRGPVSPVSVMSGKLQQRCDRAWRVARPPLHRLTLHECRHTYASFLMAAGYTLKEIMEYMGHADLQMVQRYVKLLPQPDERDPAERLNAYLQRSRDSIG